MRTMAARRLARGYLARVSRSARRLCPGRCAGRLPGSYPGPLGRPTHLPALTAAEPLAAGEMDLTLRTGTDD